MGARLRRLSEVDRSRHRSRSLLPPLRRKFPRPFPESSRVDCRNIWLRRVSFTAQASLPVESRAGLTGWYSGRENESR
jgi:hypothetical protein